MSRVFNFGAGPATMPESVLQIAQGELLDWQGEGMSIMEISHRSSAFKNVIAELAQNLRDVLAIPDNYHVLFATAPARSQFSAVPLNLLGDNNSADYFNTGIWSKVAIEEAQRYADINLVVDTESTGYTSIPSVDNFKLNPSAAYVHYTDNESINGVEFKEVPVVGDVPLVSDMTSSLMTKPIDVSRFGVIYAGAQKNLGPAGLTIIIIRDDLLGKAHPLTPRSFDYKALADSESLEYTPATFTYYMAGLMLQWIIQSGGLQVLQDINQRKANKLYQFIDSNDFYSNPIDPLCRSRVNIPFVLANSNLDGLFLEEAKQAGMVGLKGHRFLGGMRASIYNAMPEEGVDALIDFMSVFAGSHA